MNRPGILNGTDLAVPLRRLRPHQIEAPTRGRSPASVAPPHRLTNHRPAAIEAITGCASAQAGRSVLDISLVRDARIGHLAREKGRDAYAFWSRRVAVVLGVRLAGLAACSS